MVMELHIKNYGPYSSVPSVIINKYGMCTMKRLISIISSTVAALLCWHFVRDFLKPIFESIELALGTGCMIYSCATLLSDWNA